MNKKVLSILDNFGIGCEDCDSYYELEWWSDAGEDMAFEIDKTNTKQEIQEIINYCNNFDWEEHCEPLIAMRGQQGVPYSIEALVDDAKSISDMLDSLAYKLEGLL